MTAPNGSNGIEQNGNSVPKPRAAWIAQRRAQAAQAGDQNFSQMHYARKGLVTEEMVYIAEKEKLSPEAVLTAASDSNPRKQQKQQCEAYFYIGQYHAVAHRDAEAQSSFQNAIATCPPDAEWVPGRGWTLDSPSE